MLTLQILPGFIAELPEYIGINNQYIKLIDSKQPFYEPIYSLEPMELETLETYIKTNLANDFIRPSKSLVDAPIFFVWKLNKNLHLCVNY